MEKAIQEIMNNFDFKKVHKVMIFLNWEWWDEGVPSIKQLKETASELLSEVIKKGNKSESDNYEIQTGGFSAIYSDKKNLRLLFVIENYWS